MKALTICQPWAHIIVTPQDELPAGIEQKRVENRRWPVGYRGPLAIHAGKGTKYLMGDAREKYPGMVFGAIVGIAELVDCVQVFRIHGIGVECDAFVERRHPWLCSHQHTEGPWCWILEDVRRIEPVYCNGKRGLWESTLVLTEEIGQAGMAKGAG